MQFTTSIVFAFCAVASFISGTAAIPIQLAARTVFDPPVTFPTTGDVFYAGQTITATWDTTGLPAGLLNEGLIVLAQPVGDSEGIKPNSTLADGFLLTTGHQTITFPRDLPTADNYAIVLFGDSGNISNEFTIIGSDYSDSDN